MKKRTKKDNEIMSLLIIEDISNIDQSIVYLANAALNVNAAIFRLEKFDDTAFLVPKLRKIDNIVNNIVTILKTMRDKSTGL